MRGVGGWKGEGEGGSNRRVTEQMESKQALSGILTGKEYAMPKQSLEPFSAVLCVTEQRQDLITEQGVSQC